MPQHQWSLCGPPVVGRTACDRCWDCGPSADALLLLVEIHPAIQLSRHSNQQFGSGERADRASAWKGLQQCRLPVGHQSRRRYRRRQVPATRMLIHCVGWKHGLQAWKQACVAIWSGPGLGIWLIRFARTRTRWTSSGDADALVDLISENSYIYPDILLIDGLW